MHHELPGRLDLGYYRKQAKALARSFRTRDPEAVERVEDVLGGRSRDRFLLSDAQHVVAVEHGYRAWADFKRSIESALPEEPVGRIGLADVSYYEQRADELIEELKMGSDAAARRVRAHVPRLAGLDDEHIRGAGLSSRDPKLVIAREYGFPTWRQLVHYVRKAIAEAASEPRPARMAGREAVAAGDAGRLRELLAEHPRLADDLLEDLTQPDVFGERLGPELGVDLRCAELLVRTADNVDVCLNLAGCFNRVELVRLLLAAGADVESVEIWGITPLESALYHGSREAAELLAAHKIVPFALWAVAALGRVDLMEEFFEPDGRLRPEAGAHRPDLSKVGWPPGPPPGDDENTILEEAFVHACHNGHDEAVTRLLDRGVDVNARPYLGVTGLHLAVQFGHLSTVRLLVERGARLDLEDGVHHGVPLGWAEFQAVHDPARRPVLDFLARYIGGIDRLGAIRAELEAARSTWGELGEVEIDGGVAYRDGEPVRVLVRKRGRRYDISDQAAAVEKARRPPGWFKAAERVVAEYWLNVNRRGVVFVPVVEGRDLGWPALRVADTSLALYAELLELEGG